MKVDAVLHPAELAAHERRDLGRSVCVVFDVLRATSTIAAALHHGAEAVIPLAGIEEARALRRERPEVLLGGEREGRRIEGFDLGNSPREYTAQAVRGRVIASTTTNGTRALRACAGAGATLAASLLNLAATAAEAARLAPERLWLVCSGTGAKASLEDALAAGALAEALARTSPVSLSDAAQLARRCYLQASADLDAAVRSSHNARRLLEIPELREDVAFCLRRDALPLVARLDADGAVRRAIVT